MILIEIHKLTAYQYDWIHQAADLLTEAFPHSWPEHKAAAEEVYEALEENKIALVATENGKVTGFIGAMPKYGMTGWELHPLVVSQVSRGKKIGARLVKALEQEIFTRGGIMIYLGTDDERAATSLSGCNLYDGTFEKIMNIENYKNHPYEFYQKQGYQIVGVFPDANGLGKPDIWMAKRLVPYQNGGVYEN